MINKTIKLHMNNIVDKLDFKYMQFVQYEIVKSRRQQYFYNKQNTYPHDKAFVLVLGKSLH